MTATAIAAMLSASAPAFAGGKGNTNNTNVAISGSEANANANNGGVHIRGAASAPGLAATGPCAYGGSFGVVGASAGLAIPGKDCMAIWKANKIDEAKCNGKEITAMHYLGSQKLKTVLEATGLMVSSSKGKVKYSRPAECH